MKKPENTSQLKKYLDTIRKSISNYCVEECHAYCCQKGYLLLNEIQTKLIFNDNNVGDIILKNDFLKQNSINSFSLYLGNTKHCPRLSSDFKCKIHNNENRPSTCRDFPIFIHDDDSISFSKRCFAHKENKFYPYIYQLKTWGYTIF